MRLDRFDIAGSRIDRPATRYASIGEHGYQEIAGRAVDDGEEDLEPRAGRPDRIERQLGRFPQEMACASKSQIRK
jgi:hypothetical protein